MKKILLSSLLAASVMFGADANVCPDLSKKSDNIGLSQGIKTGLIKSHILSWNVYSDSLKAYNKTNDIDAYIREDILSSYGATPMWTQLAKLKFTVLDSNTDIANRNKSSIEYKELLSSIDKQNPNWCNDLTKKVKADDKKSKTVAQDKNANNTLNAQPTVDYAAAEKALQKTDRSRPSAAFTPLNKN